MYLILNNAKGIKIRKLNWEGNFTPSSTSSLNWNTKQLQLFLPCIINDELQLLGIWTKQANFPNFRYIGQFWIYLQIHKNNLKNR